MKKLLSILGTFSLTALGVSNLSACNGDVPKKETKPKNINLPNQNEILKAKKIQEDFINTKQKFLGDLSILPPEKIIVKNPRKVSYEELKKNLDKTLTEAAKKINKSFTKNDIDIEFISCNDSGNNLNFTHFNDFDLSLPVTARINIFSKENNSNQLLFSVLLPAATIN